MNILDENILKDQRILLLNWGVPVRQIGYEVGRKGMKDEEIIPFCSNSAVLHSLPSISVFINAISAIPGIAWFIWMLDRMRQRIMFGVYFGTKSLILK
jgi:hypothetical protein